MSLPYSSSWHDGVRPRPDQRHVAGQNVEELRQLVDTAGAQQAAEPRYSGVIASRLPYRAAVFQDRHRAEFVNRELAAVEAAAALAKDDRTIGKSNFIATAVSNSSGDKYCYRPSAANVTSNEALDDQISVRRQRSALNFDRREDARRPSSIGKGSSSRTDLAAATPEAADARSRSQIKSRCVLYPPSVAPAAPAAASIGLEPPMIAASIDFNIMGECCRNEWDRMLGESSKRPTSRAP